MMPIPVFIKYFWYDGVDPVVTLIEAQRRPAVPHSLPDPDKFLKKRNF
jgi:hypothetical protein